MLITELNFGKLTNHNVNNPRGRYVHPDLRVRAMKRAHEQVAYWVQRYANYEQACKDWYEQGYSPHYCVHGTNMWVDYDCACWSCEQSEDLRKGWQRFYEDELRGIRTMLSKMQHTQSTFDKHPDAPAFTVEETVDWVNEAARWALYADIIERI